MDRQTLSQAQMEWVVREVRRGLVEWALGCLAFGAWAFLVLMIVGVGLMLIGMALVR